LPAKFGGLVGKGGTGRGAVCCSGAYILVSLLALAFIAMIFSLVSTYLSCKAFLVAPLTLGFNLGAPSSGLEYDDGRCGALTDRVHDLEGKIQKLEQENKMTHMEKNKI
jgi:hypothetical protein